MDDVLGRRLCGLGLQVDDDGFGMGGLGGAAGLASRTGGYGMGFLPAQMSDHGRADRLERVLRECLGVPGLFEVWEAGRPGSGRAGLDGAPTQAKDTRGTACDRSRPATMDNSAFLF